MHRTYLLYLKLSPMQRYGLVGVFSLLIVVITYFGIYQKALADLHATQSALVSSKTHLTQAVQLIHDSHALQAQTAAWLKSMESDEDLLSVVHQAQINEAQFNPVDEQHATLTLNTQWQNLMDFFSRMTKKNLAWEMTAITIEQKEIAHEIEVQMQLQKNVQQRKAVQNQHKATFLSNTDPFSAVQSPMSVSAITMRETQWVGVLQRGTQWFAFLKLPEGKIIGLSVGESFSQSTWKIISITANEVVLQDQRGEQRVVKLLPFAPSG